MPLAGITEATDVGILYRVAPHDTLLPSSHIFAYDRITTASFTALPYYSTVALESDLAVAHISGNTDWQTV